LQPTCTETAFATHTQASATLHHSPTSLEGMFFTTATSITTTKAATITTISTDKNLIHFLFFMNQLKWQLIN
jgi:hypothetical protein